MKEGAGYTRYRILSTLVIVIPMVMIVITGIAVVIWGETINLLPIVIIEVPVIIICLVARKPLEKKYFAAKEQLEYDEFGQRKRKSRYMYSKAQQEQLELSRMMDMERILSKSTIQRITKAGSFSPVKEMDELIGLEPVKKKMKQMVARMSLDESSMSKRDIKNGKFQKDARHMVFFGSPGTGKTTVARILTGFLHKYHYIQENKCIEVDGNFLKAGTPADTATKVKYLVRKAYGGVLFVDEAYALNDRGNGCGQEAIATLIKEMEDHRDNFILILAGYTDEMKALLEANPGFHSRIKEYLNFPDYSSLELREIFIHMANEKNFVVSAEALDKFDIRMEKERKQHSFGNARTVRNVLDETIDRHALNLMEKIISKEEKYRIVGIDVCPNVDMNRI